MRDHREVLIAPVVSEKSYGMLDENKYTFIVAPDANKTEIKIAVEKIFKVRVLKVRLCKSQLEIASTSLEALSPSNRRWD